MKIGEIDEMCEPKSAAEGWRFDPWNLNASDARLNGIRLLVVAESHYREGRPLDDFRRGETQEIVAAHGLHLGSTASRSSLFRKIASTLAVDGTSGSDVWRSIYFYNYFQRPMETPTERPTTLDYEVAASAFDALLRHLIPDAILIMSARVWRDMKNECVFSGECALGEIFDFTGSAGLRVPGAHTHHPSARRPRFDPSQWRDRVADFLAYVARRRTGQAGH